MGPCGIFLAEYTLHSMHILLTKIRTAVYRATVVANARYRGDVLNLQAMGLTYSTLLFARPFSCRNVFCAEGLWGTEWTGTRSSAAAPATRGRSITGDKDNHKLRRQYPHRYIGCSRGGHVGLYGGHAGCQG